MVQFFAHKWVWVYFTNSKHPRRASFPTLFQVRCLICKTEEKTTKKTRFYVFIEFPALGVGTLHVSVLLTMSCVDWILCLPVTRSHRQSGPSAVFINKQWPDKWWYGRVRHGSGLSEAGGWQERSGIRTRIRTRSMIKEATGTNAQNDRREQYFALS